MNEVQIVTPLDFGRILKSQPERIFGNRHPNPMDILNLLSLEAMILGANEIKLTIDGDWHIIFSPSDWLIRSSDLNPLEQFKNVVPFPEGSDNSMRFEFPLYIFANTVLTNCDNRIISVKGNEVYQNISLSDGFLGRYIAFKF